jgi:hypothetical protein
MRKVTLFLAIFSLAAKITSGQTTLSPGFDATEYLQLLQIFNAQTAALYPESASSVNDSSFVIPDPANYRMVYRSPEVGLYNRWSLWLSNDSSVAVISIRGTVMKPESWLENFFAVMMPATGSMKINDSTTFSYKLAENPRAAIHTGWLLGLAYLSPSILEQIKKYDQLGVKQYIIFGHSQGGAIAYLLRSYLYYLPDTLLPKNIIFKTYCSAAPKPGNLYYAYDFDFINRGGWAFRVVNSLDWVPETPFSVQTLQDFNEANPFTNIKPALKKASWLVRLYTDRLFRRINGSTQKANEKLRKILGDQVYKLIHRWLPQFPKPEFSQTINYMPAGIPIILMPYPGYDDRFHFDGKNVFLHHGLKPYYLLTLHDYGERQN